MFAKVHPPSEIKSGNAGSCHDLAVYLDKEEGEEQAFFSHTEDHVMPEEVIISIDNNRQGLLKTDAKFYMLSLNPSEAEQRHLVGRDVKDLAELSAEERKAVFSKLQTFTRSAMDDYAANFGRTNIKDGGDLMYFARIETTRTYKPTDEEVKAGTAKIGDPKPGLNFHAHVIVSHKSMNGKVKLSPGGKSQGNEWIFEGRQVKRGFSHEGFKVKVQETFNRSFDYQPIKEEIYQVKAPEQTAVLNQVKNPDLKDLLSSHNFTAANQIVHGMIERGYSHTVRKGVHTFNNGSESLQIAHTDLKLFEKPLSAEQMKNIVERFDMDKYKADPRTYNENNLIVKNISFCTLKPDEVEKDKNVLKSISYQVIYDAETKTTLPLSAVKQQAYENRVNLVKSELNSEDFTNKLKNADLKDLFINYRFTAANQIVHAMGERGYSHRVRKGVHTFTKVVEGRTLKVSVSHKDLKRLEIQPDNEQMKELISRYNMFKYKQDKTGYNENDISGKRIEFSTYKPGKDGSQVLKTVSYEVLYDDRTKTTVPVSAIRKFAKENNILLFDRIRHSYAVSNPDLRECLKNTALINSRQINVEMKRRGYTISTNEQGDYVYSKSGSSYSMPRRDLMAFTGFARNDKQRRSAHSAGAVNHVSGVASSMMTGNIQGKIMNEILGDSFRTERQIGGTVKKAVNLINNPANIKMMLIKKIASFLNPLKEI